jgi:NAD(P)-dependent dehydrogenase (short-subunit alcohol dehydrogenase family)
MHRQQVALITGANKGIGREIARQLGRRGMRVLLGARDAERGEAAAQALRAEGLDARFIHLDVTRRETVEEAARRIEAEPGRLDVLINNAAIAGLVEGRSAPSALPLDAIRATYETNVFGPILVTQLMLPLLRRAPAARIVNMSSGLGSLTLMSDPASQYAHFSGPGYSATKSALNAVTVAFAHELRPTRIKVNAADPGYTATDLNGHTGTRSVEQAAKVAIQLATLDDGGPTGGFFDETGPVPW